MAILPSRPAQAEPIRRAGTGSQRISSTKQTRTGFGEEPVLDRRRPKRFSAGDLSSAIRIEAAAICFFWLECRTNEKGASAFARLSRSSRKTLQKTVTFSSLAFLDLPFSRSDCDGLAEAGYLGLGLPLVVRVLPRLLGGGGQYGEVRAVAMDLPLLAE